MNSTSTTTRPATSHSGFSRLARVLRLGWGQITHPQIKNVGRFYSMCPEEVADFLGGRLLNFGIWNHEETTQQHAAKLLVERVAELAEIGEGDAVLDVGCGFGIAALMFHQRYHATSVVGVNVTQCHLDHATQAADEAGVGEAVQFEFGDATDLPFDDDSFDHVIALESAFHFSPREAFFREAARVLRPGGVLTIADATPLKPKSGWLLKFVAARLWLFPPANNYGPDEYVERIAKSGFAEIECESIGDEVYPGYVRWTMTNAGRGKLQRRIGWLQAAIYRWQTSLLGVLARRKQLEYILIRAVKPLHPTPVNDVQAVPDITRKQIPSESTI